MDRTKARLMTSIMTGSGRYPRYRQDCEIEVIDANVEALKMFVELSARYLMERHHAMENDRMLRHRIELSRSKANDVDDEPDRSAGIAGVSLGDGTSRRRDTGPNLGRL